MLKKIIIWIILSTGILSNTTFAETPINANEFVDTISAPIPNQANEFVWAPINESTSISANEFVWASNTNTTESTKKTTAISWNWTTSDWNTKTTSNTNKKVKKVKKCDGPNCISSPKFTIDTDNFAPWWSNIWWTDIKQNSTEGTMKVLLGVIIKNLIVIFWVLSLLVMTIGWGYMIFHAGEESLLSRWKSIFIYGLVSLVVALSAWIMVKLVSYILYAT